MAAGQGCVTVLELCLRDVRAPGGEICHSEAAGTVCLCSVWVLYLHSQKCSLNLENADIHWEYFSLCPHLHVHWFFFFPSLWKKSKKAPGFLLCREEHCFGNEQLFDNLLFCCLAVCALWLPWCFIILLFLQEDCVVSLVPSSTVSELHL